MQILLESSSCVVLSLFNLQVQARSPLCHDPTHQKCHEHPLTFFPRQLSLECDVCGLSHQDIQDPIYTCLPCNLIVHRKCIYLPRVIKITRHRHRLYLTSSLPSGDFSCGVCRKAVKVNCGQYSCTEGCQYAVHSLCATREDVWDGKDLEGVPEEPEEDVEPFVRIDEETIRHFSHDHHHLKLREYSLDDAMERCEACCLPIKPFKAFYTCMECKFVLDEACACLLRRIHNPQHKHPLTLNPFTRSRRCYPFLTECSGCDQVSCGFFYKCSEDECCFYLDATCVSLPDPLIHDCHPHEDHLLFFSVAVDKCMGCQEKCSNHYLECTKCTFTLGLKCATLPTVAHYKHDSHPLTLCYGEEDITNLPYWCEICESKLDASKWFYTCDFCRLTLHVTCLLGIDMYMTPNSGKDITVFRNDASTRPFCYACSQRCPSTFAFVWRHTIFCTMKCMEAPGVQGFDVWMRYITMEKEEQNKE